MLNNALINLSGIPLSISLIKQSLLGLMCNNSSVDANDELKERIRNQKEEYFDSIAVSLIACYQCNWMGLATFFSKIRAL